MPIIDLTVGPAVGADLRSHLVDELPAVVSRAVATPDEPFDGRPRGGDVVVRVVEPGEEALLDLDVLVEVHSRWSPTRAPDRDRRCQEVQAQVQEIVGPDLTVGVFLQLPVGAWAETGDALDVGHEGDAELRRRLITRADITRDVRALGVASGDVVMVHTAVSTVGPLLNGPDAVVGGLLDAVSPGGTLLAYTDWDSRHDELVDETGRVPDAWRPHVPPFDARTSRAIRDHGVLPEFLRTWPGALRSGNPGASVAAIGTDADHFTCDHQLQFGYGADSPLARLVDAGGKVLMLGAPWDTMTLVHHAEHLADVAGKRVVRFETPFVLGSGTTWVEQNEYDTSDPTIPGMGPDFIGRIVADFVAADERGERHASGHVGAAPALLVDAAPMCRFAIEWLESWAARHPATTAEE